MNKNTIILTLVINILLMPVLIQTDTSAVNDYDEMVFSFIEEVKVRECYFIVKNPGESFPVIKTLSRKFIYSTAISASSFIKHINKIGEDRPGKLVVPDESESQEVLKQIASKQLPCTMQWLFHNIKYLDGIYVPIECKVWIRNVENRTFTMIYQVKKESEKISQYVGLIEPYFLHKANNLQLKRLDFLGIQLITVSSHANPCYMEINCLSYEIVMDLCQALNVTAVVLLPHELQGKYKGKFDVIAAVASFHSLELNFEMVAPTIKGQVNMYVQDISGAKADMWGSYFKPFAKNLWLVLLAWIFISSQSIVLIHWLIGYKSKAILIDIGFVSLDAVSKQGGITKKEFASKWSISITWILSLVIFEAYAAAIVSSLTLQKPQYPFRDIDGFKEDGTYKLGSINNSFSINYIKRSESPNIKEISSKMTIPDDEMPANLEEGIIRMCTNAKFAFTFYNNAVDMQRNVPCSLLRIPTPITSVFAGIPVARNSTFKPFFKIILTNFHTSGIISKMQKSLQIMPFKTSEKFQTIEIYQIVVPVLILAVGSLIALFVFYLENFWHSRKNSRNTENKHFGKRLRKGRAFKLNQILKIPTQHHSLKPKKSYKISRSSLIV